MNIEIRQIPFLVLLLFILGCSTKQSDSVRPNVIFILADDLGFGDLQCYGNPYLETPNINQLASDGSMFTRYYSPSPLCAPARAGILTGRYNHRTGAIDVSSNRGIDRITLSERTAGDLFKKIGYKTGLIGKWHNGLYDEQYLPYHRGFDYFYGFLNGIQDYYNWNLDRNGVNHPSDSTYLTDELTKDALAYIENNKDDPFFLILAYHAPHSPFQAPEELVEKYIKKSEGKYGRNVATIYAMIEAMDTGIGYILTRLEELKLDEHTIVVFTSDNGPILSGKEFNESTIRYNGQWSGMKGWTWEGGIRVPAIIRWKGTLPKGQTINRTVIGIDWLPTFFDLIGESLEFSKPLDGVSIKPLLLDGVIDDRPLFFQKNRYYPVAHSDGAVTSGNWKLYWPEIPKTMQKEKVDNPSVQKGSSEPHWLMPIDTVMPRWQGVKSSKPMLFDLSIDPSEQHDVSVENPELVKKLAKEYEQWFQDVISDYEKAWTEIKAVERGNQSDLQLNMNK